LADLATHHFPGVKVLFTSGYMDSALLRQGALMPGVILLPKPYRRNDLLQRLAALMRESPSEPS
jgi:hypothetical protein